MRRSWPKYLPVFLIIAFLLLCFLDVSTNPIRSIFIGVGIALLVLELVYFIALSNNGFFDTLFNKILSITIFPVMVIFLISLIYFIGWGLSEGDSVKFMKEGAPSIYLTEDFVVKDEYGFGSTLRGGRNGLNKYELKELNDDKSNKEVELEITVTTQLDFDNESYLMFDKYEDDKAIYESIEVYYDNTLATSYEDHGKTYYSYTGTSKGVDVKIIARLKLNYITIDGYKGYIARVGRNLDFSDNVPGCKIKHLKYRHWGRRAINYYILICDEDTPDKYMAEGYDQYIYGKTIAYIGYSICGVIALSKIVGFTIYNIKNKNKKEEK